MVCDCFGGLCIAERRRRRDSLPFECLQRNAADSLCRVPLRFWILSSNSSTNDYLDSPSNLLQSPFEIIGVVGLVLANARIFKLELLLIPASIPSFLQTPSRTTPAVISLIFCSVSQGLHSALAVEEDLPSKVVGSSKLKAGLIAS
jgi:hypothetical protein